MAFPNQRTTLFSPGTNCCAVARADRVALLVDGAAYFSAFMRAAERAQRSIIILAWDFDSRTPLSFDENGKAETSLGEFLNGLAKRRRQLHIHVLDWDYPMVFGTDREFPPLYGINWKPHRRVHFRYDATHPIGGSHHQKIIIIDDKLAFVGGLDLTNKRWDTPEHTPADPRRTTDDESYPPFHDSMIAVDGAAAQAIAVIARARWQHATRDVLRPVQVLTDPWPDTLLPDMSNVDLAVACTSPAMEGRKGVRDIERLYLDMIAAARRYVYIENQYFTSAKIGDAIAARLAEDDPPEFILVTRLLSHGWLEEMTMHVLRTRLVKTLKAADRQQRFHAYYPHIDNLEEGTCIDMHSKIMIVDDQWLRIGSSNLSNRSMGLDTECDLVLEAGADQAIAAGIRSFRDRLVAEHMGVSTELIAAAIEQQGSMQSAITALASPGRLLKPLEDLPDWSDAVVNTVALADPEHPVPLEGLVTQFTPHAEIKRRLPMWKMVFLTALVLLGLAALWRYTPLADIVTADSVVQWATGFSDYWWAPLVIMLAYTPACFIMFPRPLITLAAVVAFGPWLGFGYAMTGILFSAVVTYVLGRRLPRDTVRRLAGEKLNRMTDVLRKQGLLAVTAMRLVPIAPFFVEGLVAGAVRIKTWHFVAGTFIGMLPGLLATTVFGDQLQAALRDPSMINYWPVAGAVAFLVITALVVRKWLINVEAKTAKRPAAKRVINRPVDSTA